MGVSEPQFEPNPSGHLKDTHSESVRTKNARKMRMDVQFHPKMLRDQNALILSLWVRTLKGKKCVKTALYHRHNISRDWNTKTLTNSDSMCFFSCNIFLRNHKLKLIQFTVFLFVFYKDKKKLCICTCVFAFFTLSDSKRVSLRWPDGSDSKFWFRNTREKVKSDL